MKKKIFMSLFTISIVGAMMTGAAVAYFSDTETSSSNVFQAGTIDISVDGENPWVGGFTVMMGDDEYLKPCETGYIEFTVKNDGNNPCVVWKHVGNIVTAGGLHPESEEAADPSDTINYIHYYINYDLEVGTSVIFEDADELTVADISSMWMPLGQILNPGDTMTVTQSYHMRADTGNWAQGDTMTFDIDLYAEQRLGNGPNQMSYRLFLDNKTGEPDWYFIADDTWGILNWDASHNASFVANGLTAITGYTLITYTDPWPGSPATHIAHGTSDASGNISWTGLTVPTGFSGKVWLVLTADYNSGSQLMTGWNPTSYLFEANKVVFP